MLMGLPPSSENERDHNLSEYIVVIMFLDAVVQEGNSAAIYLAALNCQEHLRTSLGGSSPATNGAKPQIEMIAAAVLSKSLTNDMPTRCFRP